MLCERGVFATQIPLFEEMKANQCIIEAEKRMADKFIGIETDKYVLHSLSQYYDMLSNATDKISVWITDYCHEMGKSCSHLKDCF